MVYTMIQLSQMKVSVADASWHCVYDGQQVVADVDRAGVTRRAYVNGPGIDNILAMVAYSNGIATTYYYIKDHLGSVHAVADSSGNVVESYRYDAWGRVLGVYDGNGTPLTQSAIGNRFLWQGREYSWNTGLYYFRARWYDPVVGRWLSRDPIGEVGFMRLRRPRIGEAVAANTYGYVGNVPLVNVDALGLAHIVNNTSFKIFALVNVALSETCIKYLELKTGSTFENSSLPAIPYLVDVGFDTDNDADDRLTDVDGYVISGPPGSTAGVAGSGGPAIQIHGSQKRTLTDANIAEEPGLWIEDLPDGLAQKFIAGGTFHDHVNLNIGTSIKNHVVNGMKASEKCVCSLADLNTVNTCVAAGNQALALYTKVN
jgi:RHS repeat-associated protein